MEKMIHFYVLILSVLTYTMHGLDNHHNICNITSLEDEYKHINVSNPLERKILIGTQDKRECWVNMADLYNNFIMTNKVKLLLDKNSRVMILVKFSCVFPIVLHFNDFNVQNNSFSKRLNLDLQFIKCSFIMKEVDAFLNIGKIILLSKFGNFVKAEPSTNCKFASDIQVITLQAACDDTTVLNNLFWESCTEIFLDMTVLKIIGCKHKYQSINSKSVREKFPSLESLVLNFVQIDGPIHFPWNKHTLAQNKNKVNSLMASFVSYKNIYFYNMFPGNSFILINCRTEIKSMHLEDNIETLELTKMGLTYIHSNFLQNVTLKQTLDLSNNRLNTISVKLLINQHMLQELYLQQNELTYISESMFSALKHLIYINLSSNKIKHIVGTPFTSLNHLKDILLNNNSLVQIPDDMFRDQTNSLEFLYINSNPAITKIPFWPIYATNLKYMDLSNGNITGQSIIKLLDDLDQLDINEKLVEAGMERHNLPLSNMGSIKLSSNKIETIPQSEMTVTYMKKLKNFLKSFIIDFRGNPFTCNCDTSVIQEIAYDSNNTNDYMIGWICQKPMEFRGRPMWTIDNNEKYCPIKNPFCPDLCSCFKRNNEEIIIVDCRDTVLQNMPIQLPKSLLELWFQNSNISEIRTLSYLENVTVLNLAHNNLHDIKVSALNKLKRLKIFDLQSNDLKTLPYHISSLDLTKLMISGNMFICDCKTSWMKTWILQDENTIPDWMNVKCLDTYGNLKQLIAVPDSEFICKKADSFSVTEHVFLPSVVTGSILFVLVTVSLIVYFQRFYLKVQLFIHFNFHPFDNIVDRAECHVHNAVIIYGQSDLELKVKIEKHLTEKGYNIADMYNNAKIGYTYIKNIEYLISKSNKIILLISTDTLHDKIIQAAWNIGYDKVMSTAITRMVLIADKAIKHEPNIDDNLSQFLTSKNFLDRKTKLLPQKVEYLMAKSKDCRHVPSAKLEMNQGNHNQRFMVDKCDSSVDKIVISYPDEQHSYVQNEIIPFLSENYAPIKLLDMEFTPGADIRDQLPIVLDTSRHLIFLFSSDTCYNAVRMYILSQALMKTQLENQNYLILCTSGPVSFEHVTNALSGYLENYVTISVKHPRFKERILESICTISNEVCDEEHQVENDPLL